MLELRDTSKDGSPHVTDDVINTVIHLAAAIFSLLGGALLITRAAILGNAMLVTGVSVYVASLFLLFLASSLYHGLSVGRQVERALHLLDYCAIFILIAGSMTPIALAALPPSQGWPLFGVTWLVAAVGIVMKLAIPSLPKWVTNTFYVTMGWLPVALCLPLKNTLGADGVGLAVLGGLFYTLGAAVFAAQRPNPIPGKFGFHEIWHLAVVAGAATHYFMIYGVVLARG